MANAAPAQTTLAGGAGKQHFPHRNLLGMSQLNQHEILDLLDRAEAMIPSSRQPRKTLPKLRGKTQRNLFFEP